MRLLKPLLAGAALLTLSVPALASAQPYHTDRGPEYQRTVGYEHRDRAYGYRHHFHHVIYRGWEHRGYDHHRWHRHHNW